MLFFDLPCDEGEEIQAEERDSQINYPKYDNTQFWAKVPSQELSDALVKAFKDKR